MNEKMTPRISAMLAGSTTYMNEFNLELMLATENIKKSNRFWLYMPGSQYAE